MTDATQPAAQQGPQQPARELVTPAEYARRIGKHRSTVTRQMQSGLLPSHDGMIDPVEADEARRVNLDEAKQRLRAAQPAPPLPPAEPVSPLSEPELPLGSEEDARSAGALLPEEGTLKAAQIQERRAKASLAEIELAKQRGELVRADAVEQEWSRMVQTARDRLLLIPERLAPRLSLAKEEAECRSLLQREIEEALQALAAGAAHGVAA